MEVQAREGYSNTSIVGGKFEIAFTDGMVRRKKENEGNRNTNGNIEQNRQTKHKERESERARESLVL